MPLSFDSALGVHESALKVRTQRAEVLANNLANVNTPNYKARDIDFREALRAQSEPAAAMQSTDHRHFSSGGARGEASNTLYRTPGQPSIDGNTVEEQVEHSEYMKNALEFQASFTFLNNRFKGMMTALRGQ